MSCLLSRSTRRSWIHSRPVAPNRLYTAGWPITYNRQMQLAVAPDNRNGCGVSRGATASASRAADTGRVCERITARTMPAGITAAIPFHDPAATDHKDSHSETDALI